MRPVLSPALRRGLGALYARSTELQRASSGAARWRECLAQGLLPSPAAEPLEWPPEPLRSEWLRVLAELDVPRFSRRHPALLDTTMLNLLHTVSVFRRQSAAPGADAGAASADAADNLEEESSGATVPSDSEPEEEWAQPPGEEQQEAAASLAMEQFIDAWQPEAEAADAAGALRLSVCRLSASPELLQSYSRATAQRSPV